MKLPAQVTMDNAAEIVPAIEAALDGGDGVLQIDASALAELDSAAIALLLQARRLAEQRGKRFELSGAPAKLTALASLYGVDSLLAA